MFKFVYLKECKIGWIFLSEIKQINRKFRKVLITCPICKTKKEVKIPLRIIDETRQLTTVSIPRGISCEHHYQLFIDKNYDIRGYQKVDFEVCNNKNKLNKMSLKEIYEEFWEYIDDENTKFKSFVLKDSRRNSYIKKKELFIREITTENIHKSSI
jgi:hypothetical protein